MIIKRVGVVSIAKMYAAICVAVGLLFGVIVALASVIGAGMAEGDTAMFGSLLGVGAVVALPIVYGVTGFIAGAVGGALYNLFAGMVGGVRIEVE